MSKGAKAEYVYNTSFSLLFETNQGLCYTVTVRRNAMNKVIGILAHVDAGKTTFCENLLYNSGIIRTMGRVDRKSSFMDNNSIEQERGITVFAENGVFEYNGNTYYLMDTPGHTDFSPEAERALCVLDYAVMIISGIDGVQAHTVTLYRLLQKRGIPVFFFINKTDSPLADTEKAVKDIHDRLTEDAVYITSLEDGALAEFTAERSESFMEMYFEGYTREDIVKYAGEIIKDGKGSVIMSGSALASKGIEEFFFVFDALTFTEYDTSARFKGEAFKIRHSPKGERHTYIKVLEGSVLVKGEAAGEKINEIRLYNGAGYTSSDKADAGQIVVITGVRNIKCGDIFSSEGVTDKREYSLTAALEAGVNILDNTDSVRCMECLKILEEEEPCLKAEYRRSTDEIVVRIMGAIQPEILEAVIKERFSIELAFGKPRVQYRETIKAPVLGIGHYEPLRHYAEVCLELAPLPRNSGIEYESQCHTDMLAANYQSLIKTHIFEREHKGILTGSPLTDIKYILKRGRAHIKHTEGGDFREAVYRGIRQGLEKAENILLEPFYSFEIYAGEEYAGRIMTDIQKMRGSFEPPENRGGVCLIKGRGPVAEFGEYPQELMSYTRGTGAMTLMPNGYEECSVADSVIEEIGYDKGADKENTSCSVFCKKGAGYTVSWDQVDALAHTLR